MSQSGFPIDCKVYDRHLTCVPIGQCSYDKVAQGSSPGASYRETRIGPFLKDRDLLRVSGGYEAALEQ